MATSITVPCDACFFQGFVWGGEQIFFAALRRPLPTVGVVTLPLDSCPLSFGRYRAWLGDLLLKGRIQREVSV